MDGGEKREAIIRAALELVGEHGFHGSPMAQIAERAGVAAGTIYRFFDSKDALIREIKTSLDGQILDAVAQGYPAGGSVRERFLHVQRRVIGYFVASPLQFRFLEQFHFSPYGLDARREQVFGKKRRNLIADLIEEGLAQRIVKDLPLPILYALAFGPVIEVCRDHILEFVTLDERLIERTVEACWDAIRRQPGGSCGPAGARK
ncbi:MAG TPA: TetR/AcrR family transcriptional regulator [bacterium]